jgi:predicted nuclease with TOPRIM domain
MRARRREINIFNMSLLDILCGALGAFCFMMLVALPYYIPPGSGLELRKAQKETDRLLVLIEKFKDKLPDQKSIEEMEKLMRELEAQVKALQGRVNILTAEKEELRGRVDQLTTENEQLRAEVNQLTAEKDQLQAQVNQLTGEKEKLQARVNQLTAEKQQLADRNQQLEARNEELVATNEELTRRLNQKKPFVVLGRADEMSQSIQINLIDKIAIEKRSENVIPTFNAWLNGQFDMFPQFQVQAALLFGRGTAFGMMPEVKMGGQYKAYVRLANAPAERRSTVVDSALFGDAREQVFTRMPKVTLSPEHFWILLGTVTIDERYQPAFKEATAAEREAEWAALTPEQPGPTLGPPAPSATPTPPSEEILKAGAEARAKRQEIAKKFGQLLRLQHKMDSDEGASEILPLADEFIKTLPPGDSMRREAENMRERTLDLKARREREQPQRQPGPTLGPAPRSSPQLAPSP